MLAGPWICVLTLLLITGALAGENYYKILGGELSLLMSMSVSCACAGFVSLR